MGLGFARKERRLGCKFEAMTKILTLIFFAVCSLGMKPIENNFINEDCYKLLEAAKRPNCGIGQVENYMNVIDCFMENGSIDEAIDIFYKHIGKSIEMEGIYLNKYIQLIENKYKRREIRRQLKQVTINADLDYASLESLYGVIDFKKEDWDEYELGAYFNPGIRIFETGFPMSTSIETAKEDAQVFKNYLHDKISKSDLEEYFQKRWLESSLYKALAN